MDTRDNPKLRDALYGEAGFKQHRYTYPPADYSDSGSHVKSMFIPVKHKIKVAPKKAKR